MRALKARGAALKATEQPIDTSTAAGKAFLDMLGVFAEFETNLRRERQMEGIAAAKARGVYAGKGRKTHHRRRRGAQAQARREARTRRDRAAPADRPRQRLPGAGGGQGVRRGGPARQGRVGATLAKDLQRKGRADREQCRTKRPARRRIAGRPAPTEPCERSWCVSPGRRPRGDDRTLRVRCVRNGRSRAEPQTRSHGVGPGGVRRVPRPPPAARADRPPLCARRREARLWSSMWRRRGPITGATR